MQELSKEKITEIFRDKNKLEDFIQNIDQEGFRDFLLTLHSDFIRIPKQEDKISDVVGGIEGAKGKSICLCAPNIEIKESLLEELPKCIKKLPSNRDRGILLHYLINELHLFSDGNGRTGRAMLELFLNDKFDLNNETFKHKTSNPLESKREESFELEEKYGIKRVDLVMSYTSYVLTKVLYDKGLIDTKIEIDKFTRAGCSTDSLRDEDFIKNEELTKKEIEQVSIALRDKTGSLGIGALTMLIMQKLKGQQSLDSALIMQKLKGQCSLVADEMMHFVYFDLGDRKWFEGWNTEDYLKAIKIHSKLQEMQLNIMLDIFENPEKFKIEETETTIQECFTLGLNESTRELRELVRLAKSLQINLESTRTQAQLSELEEILESNKLKKNKSTNEIVKESIDGIHDFKDVEEVEQTKSYQMRGLIQEDKDREQ